ncbi:MAG: beta-N-acetylhexosaminidase [Clostridia bacterium]|nr:beta-N-acetylhexosaminidase [Clostridia bacterium]
MKKIFPKAVTYREDDGCFKIDKKLKISVKDESFSEAAEYFASLVKTLYAIDSVRVSECADIELGRGDMGNEEYTLDVTENKISITAADKGGAIYALSTLIQLINNENGFTVPSTHVEDKPYTEMRGVHFYMPARDKIESFKRIVDTMAFLKMNTVILEVGGGMQYDRHPEINTAWERFCDQLNNKFPGQGKYRALQGSDVYWKDSVHTELAGGSYLTKEEVRDLVCYCRSRGMEVIPEVQALSHSYYLCIAHPEIAERQDDPFPDTYCPSNEKSYELYFDVAEEVIEVFKPKTVSIGHDEIRVLGWCDKCKEKTGHELVGKEILRLYEFYKKKGIRIAMWGESAQTFINYKGNPVGVKDYSGNNKYGLHYHLPSTYKSLDMFPSDILMLDWYHSLGHASEDCFMERGIDVIYGNFHGSQFGDWDERSKKNCIKGAEVSSWCVPDEFTFARDGIFFEMMFSSYILWNSEYTNADFSDVCHEIVRRTPYLRAIMRGEPSALFAGGGVTPLYKGDDSKAAMKIKLSDADISDKRVKTALSVFGDELSGVSVDTGAILVKPDAYADSLLFLHNTKEEMKFEPSHLFKDENIWALGAYAVTYEDGTVEIVGVYYGKEAGWSKYSFERHRKSTDKNGAEIDIDVSGDNKSATPCYFTHNHQWFESLCYSTTPVITDTCTAFAYEWKNPYPEKKISKIKAINVSQNMEQSVVLFAILSVK